MVRESLKKTLHIFVDLIYKKHSLESSGTSVLYIGCLKVNCIPTKFVQKKFISSNFLQHASVFYDILCLQSKQKTPENPLPKSIQSCSHTCMVVTQHNSVKAGHYLSPVDSTETKQNINLSHIKLPTHDSIKKVQHFNKRYGVDLCVSRSVFPFVLFFTATLIHT
jgi:hypothetical protein